MSFHLREHKLHMRSQAWTKRRVRYYRMVDTLPDDLIDRQLVLYKNTYEHLYQRLPKILALLQHYTPILWDELDAGSVSWSEYLSVADSLSGQLGPIVSFLLRLYDAGTRGGYSEDCDGYTPVRIKSDRKTPLPPTFKDWMKLQREMGRHPPPGDITEMEEDVVCTAMGTEKPATTLAIVQLYALLAGVIGEQVEHAAFDDPMRYLVINNLLGAPLPMAHPGFPDPLWMASQLKDLLNDMRCYCREQ